MTSSFLLEIISLKIHATNFVLECFHTVVLKTYEKHFLFWTRDLPNVVVC